MQKNFNFMEFINKFTSFVERVIITVLVFAMTVLLGLALIDLLYTIVNEVIESEFLLTLEHLVEIFGSVLLILVGIELLETIKIYLKESVVHVEVVVLVAIIALARKIIILDMDKASIELSVGISLLIIVLAISYYLLKKTAILAISNKSKQLDDEKDESVK